MGFEEEEKLLQCFRCDLGFWDACYTTETNCSHGERCYTGRGRAGVWDKTVSLVFSMFTNSHLCIKMVQSLQAWTKTLFTLRCYTDFYNLVSLADVLDIKTLGCVKAEECEVETTVELFSNKTIFVLTRHCCETPFCNTAHKHPVYTLLYLTVAFLITWPPHWSLKEITINHLYLFIDVKKLCVKWCWKDFNYMEENDFCTVW